MDANEGRRVEEEEPREGTGGDLELPGEEEAEGRDIRGHVCRRLQKLEHRDGGGVEGGNAHGWGGDRGPERFCGGRRRRRRRRRRRHPHLRRAVHPGSETAGGAFRHRVGGIVDRDGKGARHKGDKTGGPDSTGGRGRDERGIHIKESPSQKYHAAAGFLRDARSLLPRHGEVQRWRRP